MWLPIYPAPPVNRTVIWTPAAILRLWPRTIIDLSVQWRFPETRKAEVCVSSVSIACRRRLFSNSGKNGVIAPRPMITGCTDDADGADGTDGTDPLFSCCAYPDDSCPRAAFPGKRNLDPN